LATQIEKKEKKDFVALSPSLVSNCEWMAAWKFSCRPMDAVSNVPRHGDASQHSNSAVAVWRLERREGGKGRDLGIEVIGLKHKAAEADLAR
jgi:hypothetical protein